jgi:hypothetical protein
VKFALAARAGKRDSRPPSRPQAAMTTTVLASAAAGVPHSATAPQPSEKVPGL